MVDSRSLISDSFRFRAWPCVSSAELVIYTQLMEAAVQ
jgi:hypothetical protein